MRNFIRRILNSTTFFVMIILGVVLARIFIFVPVTVMGDSMNPTLANGERGIAVRVGKVERFDIVTFPAPDELGKNYIKRVIGLPGDNVEYREDTLFINGKPYDEPYLDDYKSQLQDGEPLTFDFSMVSLLGVNRVPQGKIFVLGDNRRISKDSRYIGFIDKKKVQGDLKFAYWPIEKAGSVE